jgi:glycosyltransferase involved in cell wall biosynthesis
MSRISDPYAHYGVDHNFDIQYIPSIDLFPLLPRYELIAFVVQTISYLVMLLIWLFFRHVAVYYSRDLFTLLALSLIVPRRRLVYEAHQLSKSGLGRRLQSLCVQRVNMVVTTTGKLAEDLLQRGAKRVMIAHDGIRLERFADLPDRDTARARLKWPTDAFIVGYVGQLHTMSMSKGIDLLIAAIGHLPQLPISLCLVGGPPSMVETLRAQWQHYGLPAERFLAPGRVEPSLVPICMAAFDVCAMPFPWTEHFAYYASPLKLFEYMAAGNPIISSDLPAVTEVVQHGKTALLVQPGDVDELADAIKRLYDDSALRERLGSAAKRESERYSWQVRGRRILKAL